MNSNGIASPRSMCRRKAPNNAAEKTVIWQRVSSKWLNLSQRTSKGALDSPNKNMAIAVGAPRWVWSKKNMIHEISQMILDAKQRPRALRSVSNDGKKQTAHPRMIPSMQTPENRKDSSLVERVSV